MDKVARETTQAHQHSPTTVIEEKYRRAMVPGTRDRVFKVMHCRCGAIFSRDRWYVPELARARGEVR